MAKKDFTEVNTGRVYSAIEEATKPQKGRRSYSAEEKLEALETMQTSGKRINVSGNKVKTSGYTETGVAFESWELSSVITITIDGREMESCGDTCIFAEKGLSPDLDFSAPEFIESHDDSPLSITSLSYKLNQYKNFFGKRRVVVIKSQTGQPIVAYSGNNVYWEVETDLPKTTKLMIDNKALYIHRANFQIIDRDLLDK